MDHSDSTNESGSIEKEEQQRFANLEKQWQQIKKKHKKLRRSRRFAYFLCIVLAGAAAAGSVYLFLERKEQYTAETEELEYRIAAEYMQWKTKQFQNYFDSQMKERREAADRLGEGDPDGVNAYIASLRRTVKGQNAEDFGAITCFTDAQTFDMSGYTIAYSGNSVIFPGAVLKGDSLFQGTADYTLLPLERTPIYLTSNQAGGNSTEINDVSYRGVMGFLDNCARKNEGQAAKEWNYYMQVYESSTELEASLGVELPNMGAFELGSADSTKESSVAVIYRQIYYTVNVEPKKSAAEYFQDGADMAALGDYEPAYVSSVDYGCMVVVLVHGNMSSEELGAKVSGCIKGVDISAGLTNIRMDSEISSQVLQYGGEQKDVGMITDTTQKKLGIVEKWDTIWNGTEDRDTIETRINDFIRTDAPATNAAPIGYTLKYLTDNSFVPAMMVTGQQTMLAEKDAVRRVKISSEVMIDWDTSEITGAPIYATTGADQYGYEFLWDSDGIGILRGQVSRQEGDGLLGWLDSWTEQNEGAVRLHLERLPYGTSKIAVENIQASNLAMVTDAAPTEVSITISDY